MQAHVPVIAIGASAGGLEACRALLMHLPVHTPAAFILVLHLDPTHDSMIVDLLDSHTELHVVQAAEGMTLRPGCLHVIPPGVFLTVAQGVIHLSEPESGKAVRLPFDALLQSLASDIGALSGCIVLSGTGTDGTKGICDIHAAGGLVIAQDPIEAGHTGMPESAIATGYVNEALPTDRMLGAINRFLAHGPDGTGPASEEEVMAGADAGTGWRHMDGDAMARRAADADTEQRGTYAAPRQDADDPGTRLYDDILAFMGDHAVQDISLYKRGTLERRIARRMAAVGFEDDEQARYLDLLRSDTEERARLASDLLIHVTSFFRDPYVFDQLSDSVIAELLEGLPSDRPLRVWVAGCSTGEEAYSMAMTCLEVIEAAGSGTRLQILASDVDPDAIATARKGFYPKSIEETVSSDRLARFFVPDDGGWRATSELRDVIVFTVADILSDPPFSGIDLLTCRNLLIYLAPEAQKCVVARCCFALRPGGLLLLGAAEMPGPGDTCFAVEHKETRTWRRVGQSNPGDLHYPTGTRESVAPAPEQNLGQDSGKTPSRRTGLADLCRRILLENYAPAAALLNAQLEVLYLFGPTDIYLKIGEGHPAPGFLGMLPKSLRARVQEAAATCTPHYPVVTVSGWRVADTRSFDIALHSVAGETEPLLLACFLDTPHKEQTPASSREQEAGDHAADLEAELATTRRELHDAVRDLEREIEAHGADKAEALSVNEEFQSTNEELLASKEELQSLNEELTALNGQLQETLELHRTTANDLQNVLYSTDVATLFLDQDLNIRFFTPTARAIFHLIPTDVGRPVTDLAAVSIDENLVTDAQKVIAFPDLIEREIAAAEEVWFLRRIQPYRTEGERVEGVVITYLDITERKRINAALEVAMNEANRANRAKSRFLAAASHDLRQPLQSMALLHRLLGHQKRSTEGARLVKLLDQTLDSMTAMLDSMLDVNRIESGIIRPDIRPVAIAPLLQRLVDEFEPQCDLKGLKLRSVPSRAWVRTDPQLLEQILRNLLSNAVKYTSKGGILIGCRRHGPRLDVSVLDSGIGVAESEIKAIFDAYYQGDTAYAFADHGLGLGLSIVHRLAELMGHPVSVRTTPRKGSAFTVELHRAEETEDDATETVARQAPVGTSKPRQTGTILLVEDEDELRALLAETLINEGHTVLAKTDAKAALAWADGSVQPPDLLLTDYELPGGNDGLGLAQDLSDILGAKVPSIILTGDITTETIKRIAASDHRQVTKPVKPAVLLAELSDLMLKERCEKAQTARRSDPSSMSVHVVDDDPAIRESMCRLFEAEGWIGATYATAEDFLAAPRPEGAACLLVDNVLPGLDGVALIARLRSQRSQLPVVMLTGHGDAATAVAAMKAGASDLIEKPARAAELLASVRHAVKIGSNGDPKSEAGNTAREVFSDLTPRERDVLAKVLDGAPNKIIAHDLGINQRTVENHRASVMRKTGAGSLPSLVRLALAAGMQSE
ncbi:chemotaxis protein CheB [Nioella halotolerans]|uniref:chemotaxis protein CheB n=1 Tax=Nioella halotolerans TaxID=2303578 RepID=UPI003F65A6DA